MAEMGRTTRAVEDVLVAVLTAVTAAVVAADGFTAVVKMSGVASFDEGWPSTRSRRWLLDIVSGLIFRPFTIRKQMTA